MRVPCSTRDNAWICHISLHGLFYNIRGLVFNRPLAVSHIRPALENFYRCLEKALLLVIECGAEEWWAAAVVQSENENSFREILLDVSLFYNAIYEQAKCSKEDFNSLPEDLRESSVFQPATNSDIQEDQQDLRKRLEGLAIEPVRFSLFGQFLGAPKQHLAEYLLKKLNWTSKQAQVNTLNTCSAILWTKGTEPPGTWGNYRFLGAGAGSSGVCSTKWMGIHCAKKEFHEQGSEGFFLKEAGILACLKHPCIVNFFCCGNGEGRGDRFIAMELMEKSLSKLIEEQKGEYFPLSVVVEIMVQIARGMKYLHEQGVAHRDLKPQNVVVNRLTCPHVSDHFCVKLVDFGMSKTKVEMSKSNTITAVGMGTTIYRAPEVHPDANLDGKGRVNWSKADVFSFSMTCAHLLSLKRPFGDMESLRELYSEVMNGRRPEVPREYPEELLALLRDCWNSNPRSRPSFMEICRRLEMFRHSIMTGFSMVDEGSGNGQRNKKRGSESCVIVRTPSLDPFWRQVGSREVDEGLGNGQRNEKRGSDFIESCPFLGSPYLGPVAPHHSFTTGFPMVDGGSGNGRRDEKRGSDSIESPRQGVFPMADVRDELDVWTESSIESDPSHESPRQGVFPMADVRDELDVWTESSIGSDLLTFSEVFSDVSNRRNW